MNVKKENIPLLVFIAVLSIISLFIIKSFILPLLFAFVLVYLTNPLYKKLFKFFKYHLLAASILILVFFMVLVVPITYCLINVSSDIGSIQDSNVEIFFNQINTKFNTQINFFDMYKYNMGKIINYGANFFLNIPQLVFQLFLIFFAYYYFSKYYNAEINYLKRIVTNAQYISISKKLEKLLKGIIYGQIFVRFVQAFIAMIAFILLGIDGAIIFGILTFFAAFLPLIGTGLIWIPLMLSSMLLGNYVLAVEIFLIGVLISTIDNFLLPYIISEKTNIGPVVTLISIVGGIQLFGIYGVVLGPFILGFLIVLIEEFFYEVRTQNPEFRKIIWTESERKEFRNIKEDFMREEFINKLESKYKLEENARS